MNPQHNAPARAPEAARPAAEKPRASGPRAFPRWVVLALAAVFVLVGVLLEEQVAVYWKAATVCLECIGIG